ncbi:NACHT domain-containing protein [Oxalobacteraceae sp. CFBP 13730]|nr:NACHT domain-containing protein [Oxalobacteraceae sp. CFBP 13730]
MISYLCSEGLSLHLNTTIPEEEHAMVDKVRASREGHHFHEAWTARRALELFAPGDALMGIAVEGLAPADFGIATRETIDIADLALYYGDDSCTFHTCTRQHILQFKYSISDAHKAAAASDMVKTLDKFAGSEKALLKQHKGKPAMQKRCYGIVTNRPISATFLAAVEHVRNDTAPAPEEKALWIQYRAFCTAVNLDPDERADFARRLDFQADLDNVATLTQRVGRRLASWSAGNDAMATARLHRLCAMVRAKAESPGEQRNVIRRIDVLDVLGLADEEQLLPAPPAFPAVGSQVVRGQTWDILHMIPALTGPLVVHAPGGSGKTVLMQSLEASAPANFEVVLFDCFAGGAYRTLEDARHRPDRGLVHIVNVLATRGLCDPLLPCQGDASALLRSFRKRLAQAVETLRANRPDSLLILLVDAADNAAQQARDRGEDAFPVALVESALRLELPEHVRLVLSCRTERQALLGTGPRLRQFAVQEFTRLETDEYVRASLGEVSDKEIDVAVARSAGNPRVLSHLVGNWDELVRRPESHAVVSVEELIAERVQAAIGDAADRDGGFDYLKPFLCGLAVLPPPIPPAEYAHANGIELAQVQSMFADLSPLLEMTSMGVIFRDEPTETFMWKRFGDDLPSLRALAKRLDTAQEESQYACYALPGLLKQLGDTRNAVELAYSERLPGQRMSDVGKRSLRILRIRTALSLAARSADPATVVGLLVELGALLHGGSQGDRFIADNPDLVALTDDIDAMRRLFTLRTRRPESRHARLTIVHLLKGDLAEAARHARRTSEWSDWRRQQARPPGQDHADPVDLLALPLDHLARGEFEATFALVGGLPLDTGFAIASRLFALARALPGGHLARAFAALCDSPVAAPFLFAAALAAWQNCDTASETVLVQQLTRSLGQAPGQHGCGALDKPHRALLDAAAAALRLDLPMECGTLLTACRLARPDVRAFAGTAHGMDLEPWVFYAIVEALHQGRAPSLRDLLPDQMHALVRDANESAETISALLAQQARPGLGTVEDDEPAESMAAIFDQVILPLTDLARACGRLLSACSDAGAAQALVAAWERLPRQDADGKRLTNPARHLDAIGRALTLRTLAVCRVFSADLAERCLQIADPGRSWTVSEQIAQVARFAAVPATLPAACKLAERVAQHIGDKPDMTWRSEAYAELARAILPVSPDDARALCRLGLSLVDEITVADTVILSEVFAVTANLKGTPLDPVRAYRFTRLCMSGIGGAYTEHFPWDRFGPAAAAALGEGALALLAQWEHEGLVKLDASLSPTVTGLLERRLLDAAPALALFMLDLPKQWYTFSGAAASVPRRGLDGGAVAALLGRGHLAPSALVDALLSQAQAATAATDAERFPIFMLHELLKQCAASRLVPGESLARMRTLLAANSALHQAQSVADSAAFEGGDVDGEPAHARLADEFDAAAASAARIASATDIADPDALELAWSKFDALGVRAPERTLFDALQQQVGYPARRRYLEALASARLPYDAAAARLAALETCLADWAATPSVQEVRHLLASRLVRADPASLVENPYGLDMVLERLARFGPTPIGAVVREVIDSICMHESHANAAVWMTLAALLAAKVGAVDAPGIGGRLFDSAMARLAAKGGQHEHGGWPEQAIDAAEGVAGLIWHRLGDAQAILRARAIGAMAVLAEHGRWSELDRLAARCEDRGTGQLGNPSYPFCHLHARCALAAGLALAALRYPATMQRYRETFLHLLHANPSHPLLRTTVLAGLEALGAHDLPLPLPLPLPRAATAADPDGLVCGKGLPVFVFGDKEKELRELASIFNLDVLVVAGLVASKIVEWDPQVKDVLADDLGPFDNYGEYHIALTQQKYVAHLCWHACFTVGDELAAARRAQGRPYDCRRWEALLARDAFLPQP